MLFNKEHLEVNPANKNLTWARTIMRHYNMYWKPVVDPQTYAHNLRLILSRYDMTEFETMFKNPHEIGFKFIPIAVVEKIRNVLFGERLQAGVSATAKALDPASENERKSDQKILETRAEFEKLMTFMQKSIGLPEYRLDQEKAKGDSMFNGNVETFDQLGLNDKSKKDINYFFRVHHKLLHEMDATEIANAVLDYNKVSDTIEHWCNDILACKTVCGQLYVDQVSGAIKHNYFKPNEVFAIKGNLNESTGCPAVGFKTNFTVAEVIRRMGKEFDFNTHVGLLVDSVNYLNNTSFVDITTDGASVWRKSGVEMQGNFHQSCDWNDFMVFKIGGLYMEWQSIDASSYKVGKDFVGNDRAYKIDNGVEVDKDGPYAKRSAPLHYLQGLCVLHFGG
jgi:hypothetical protein